MDEEEEDQFKRSTKKKIKKKIKKKKKKKKDKEKKKEKEKKRKKKKKKKEKKTIPCVVKGGGACRHPARNVRRSPKPVLYPSPPPFFVQLAGCNETTLRAPLSCEYSGERKSASLLCAAQLLPGKTDTHSAPAGPVPARTRRLPKATGEKKGREDEK